jgi:dihydropteroate synthase
VNPDHDDFGLNQSKITNVIDSYELERVAGGKPLRPFFQPALDRPAVMGVVNVTPDSFSDGGRFFETGDALAHARGLIAAGADSLDIGAESTRPGAEPVAAADELARVVPVIAAIRAESGIPISIDTMKPEVARAAVAAGATIWNDVTALRWRDDSLAAAAELGCAVVLMHMQGEPRTMQEAPAYDDVVAEVSAFLVARAEAALAAGVAREKIWLDPGLGFGKTGQHSLTLLANLDRIVALGFPVLLGASRKSFLGKIDRAATSADDRLGGSLAAALAGADAGVAAVRVHDVRETVQALAVRAAIRAAAR